MKIWTDIESFSAKDPVVTIGVFDGVHRGHYFLLNEVIRKASEMEGESVVLTLWPHPRIVLNKEPDKLRYLTTLEEKMFLLGNTGIDHLLVLPFTPEFSRLNSCDFVAKYLVEGMKLKHLVIGYNHKFGKNREGDFASLSECAKKYGFGINRLAPFVSGKGKISSSAIRNLIQEGEIDHGNELLGYTYFLQGIVKNGDKVGRKIGFPTANIRPNDSHKLIPKDGVYAVELEHEKKLHKGMLNIGYRPTLKNRGREKSIEVHLFDFQADLYDEKVTVYFRKRMRDEKKFDDLEQLKTQLVIDKSKALDILNKFEYNNKNK